MAHLAPGAQRRLVLLRHARAESGSPMGDELRPLSLEGRRQCAGVGARLADQALYPEHVLISSAVRTRQTWERLRAGLVGLPEPEVDVTDVLYGAGPHEVVDLVRAVDERVRTVLVVGHEPTMSATAALLTRVDGQVGTAHLAQVRTGLPTAGYAVLGVTEWAGLGSDGADLLDVVRPEA